MYLPQSELLSIKYHLKILKSTDLGPAPKTGQVSILFLTLRRNIRSYASYLS